MIHVVIIVVGILMGILLNYISNKALKLSFLFGFPPVSLYVFFIIDLQGKVYSDAPLELVGVLFGSLYMIVIAAISFYVCSMLKGVTQKKKQNNTT